MISGEINQDPSHEERHIDRPRAGILLKNLDLRQEFAKIFPEVPDEIVSSFSFKMLKAHYRNPLPGFSLDGVLYSIVATLGIDGGGRAFYLIEKEPRDRDENALIDEIVIYQLLLNSPSKNEFHIPKFALIQREGREKNEYKVVNPKISEFPDTEISILLEDIDGKKENIDGEYVPGETPPQERLKIFFNTFLPIAFDLANRHRILLDDTKDNNFRKKPENDFYHMIDFGNAKLYRPEEEKELLNDFINLALSRDSEKFAQEDVSKVLKVLEKLDIIIEEKSFDTEGLLIDPQDTKCLEITTGSIARLFDDLLIHREGSEDCNADELDRVIVFLDYVNALKKKEV